MERMAKDKDVKKGKLLFAVMAIAAVLVIGLVLFDEAHLKGSEMWKVEEYADEDTVVRIELNVGEDKREVELNGEQKAALQELILESEFSKKESVTLSVRDEGYRITIGVLTGDKKRELLFVESVGWQHCHIWGAGKSGFYMIENPQWEERLLGILGLSAEDMGQWILQEG